MAIDVQPLAVSRPLINIAEGNQPQVAAVVNIGASSTDVGIYDNGLLTFPGPPLPIAGVNFTRAISEVLGVPVEEAERLKKEFAYADPQIAQNAYGNMGYDDGAQQPDPQPATFDTSYQLADPSFHVAGADQTVSDFSPFDFGTAQADPPQPTEEKLDISSEDVFDLGGGQQPTEFKPVFDLDEPDVSPQPAASTFDLGGSEADSATATPDASQPFAQPADLAEPQPEQDDFSQANVPVDNMAKSVADAVTPVLIELATEIRRSLEYYATRYQNRPEQIFLCGGTARLRGLDEFLAIELGIPVQVADPMANVKVNCPKLSPQYLSEVSPFFPVSIGLAIREMLE
jgi:Tfp pilus assembly PilM family ATPase